MEHFQVVHGACEDELAYNKISSDKSIFVIERSNQTETSSICALENEDGFFFRGQAVDHSTKSLILGGEGFSEFLKDCPEFRNPNCITDFEGSYVLARWNEKELTFANDLFSIYRVICYFTDEIAIISDSLVLITECIKSMGISPKINSNIATVKAWDASGFPNSPISQELILEGAYTLQAGAYLNLIWTDKGISSTIVNRNVKDVFEFPSTTYVSALEMCANHMYSNLEMITHLFNPVIEFGLSGGLDSRLILALCLKSPKIMECLNITTNKSPARHNDYLVVEKLSRRYNFPFNQVQTNLLKENTKENRVRISNKFGFWCLASLGTYDSFYLTPHYSKYPCVISMLGVGAEQVKQTSDQSRIRKLALNQSLEIRDSVVHQVSKSLKLMGVNKDADDAMKWHHMAHKAAYHLGFKIAQSSMILRPYVQKSVFAISQLSDNPFKGESIKGPTVIHDLLILLNPELACEDYDLEHKNVSLEYANSRISELGGMITLETAKKPRCYGTLQAVNNGPAKSFLRVVSNFTMDSDLPIKQQLLMKVQRIYQEIMPAGLKELYLSCYENTIRSLNDESIELSYAGSLAARFLVFDLFD